MEVLDVYKGMTKGCIYYSDGRLDPNMLRVCQKQLREAFDGEIVSVTLVPMDFGRNIVLENRVRSYPTMIEQILTALEASTSDIVFFTEHDVLYHPSHFEIEPEHRDKFYYNCNNWRWRWETEVAVTYNYLTSLSMLCCNRDLAIEHYKLRMKHIEAMGMDAHRGREPRWARRWGYEPGTKPIRRGGFSDEEHIKWWSEFPNIDIRHKGTFSHPKTFLEEFKHKPTESWKEININDIPGWNLKELFK